VSREPQVSCVAAKAVEISDFETGRGRGLGVVGRTNPPWKQVSRFSAELATG